MWKYLRQGLTLAGLTAVLLGCDKDFNFDDFGGNDNGSNRPNNNGNNGNWPDDNRNNNGNRPNNVDMDHKGVVSIINSTNVNVRFTYRWENANNSQMVNLQPGASFFQFRNPTLDGRYQLLEVRFDSKAQSQVNQTQVEMLAPARWRGQGQPQFRDGRLYKFIRQGNTIRLVLG